MKSLLWRSKLKKIRHKFEDWMTIKTHAQSGEPEIGLPAKGKESFTQSIEEPAVAIENKGAVSPPPTPVLETKNSKKKLEIMIVDDEPIVGKRLKPALTKDGYNVEVFDDPVEATNRFDEKEFDVVVTDLRMGELNGIQVLELVKAKSAKTKVIFITGYATVEKTREAQIKGAFDFIAKPFRVNDLRILINKAAIS